MRREHAGPRNSCAAIEISFSRSLTASRRSKSGPDVVNRERHPVGQLLRQRELSRPVRSGGFLQQNSGFRSVRRGCRWAPLRRERLPSTRISPRTIDVSCSGGSIHVSATLRTSRTRTERASNVRSMAQMSPNIGRARIGNPLQHRIEILRHQIATDVREKSGVLRNRFTSSRLLQSLHDTHRASLDSLHAGLRVAWPVPKCETRASLWCLRRPTT